MNEWGTWTAIAAGGAMGALARSLVYQGLGAQMPRGGLLATLFVNLAGSFLLGLWTGQPQTTPSAFAPAWLETMLVVGFCGAFTTFSTFCADIVRGRAAGHSRRALLGLISAHSLLSLGAFFLGRALVLA